MCGEDKAFFTFDYERKIWLWRCSFCLSEGERRLLNKLRNN